MATTTTRLGLYKPAGTEQSNVVTDINNNYDKIDTAVGATICTSGTRPATSLFTGRVIHETDTRRNYVYDGTNWIIASSIPIVTATSAIVNPYEGLLIYNTTDDLIYKYRGSAWIACIATGSTNHEARYYQSTGQSIANTTDTYLAFDATAYSTADVTRDGTNTSFTLNRAGLWEISAGARLVAATSGERHIFIDLFGNARVAGQTTQTGLLAGLTCSTGPIRIASSQVVKVGMFQSSGAARLTDISGQMGFISLSWIRP